MSEGGVEFTILYNTGHYPDASLDDTKVREKEEAQHKAKILEHDIWTGVVQVMQDFIIKAADEECLSEIEDKLMGFTNKNPLEFWTT